MIQPLMLTLALATLTGPIHVSAVTPPAEVDSLQKDLDQLYAVIDSGIKSAKDQGKQALIVKMEDPEFSDKGFSGGMKTLVMAMKDHYEHLGYRVSLSSLDDCVYFGIAWGMAI